MGFNVVFTRFPGGKSKAFTLSYDDGMMSDARLIEIMRKHGLKGTFNLNSGAYRKEDADGRRMTLAQALETFQGDDVEVATHGVYHDYPTRLPDDKLNFEFFMDRYQLEQQFGKIVKGCAYAFGMVDDRVVECLKGCGIKYARTTGTTRGFGVPSNWLRFHPTCHHNDPQLKDLTERFLSMQVNREAALFYVWGHTYEFDDNNNWNVIEELAEKIGGNDEVWYCTNIEICEYIEAFNRLDFTLDEKMVYNPTATTLWFKAGEDGDMYEIKPGETLEIKWNR